MEPTQSPSDAKSYRHLTLPNGLAVLLVHDPAVADALEVGGGGVQAPGSSITRPSARWTHDAPLLPLLLLLLPPGG
jgi:hypothetical protein